MSLKKPKATLADLYNDAAIAERNRQEALKFNERYAVLRKKFEHLLRPIAKKRGK